jgi:hypothetical protein
VTEVAVRKVTADNGITALGAFCHCAAALDLDIIGMSAYKKNSHFKSLLALFCYILIVSHIP